VEGKKDMGIRTKRGVIKGRVEIQERSSREKLSKRRQTITTGKKHHAAKKGGAGSD